MGGQVVDLVNKGLLSQQTTLGRQSFPLGLGLKFPLTGWGFMPPLPVGIASQFGGVAPYWAMMGTYFTGPVGPAPTMDGDMACATIQDAGNSQATAFGFNTWPNGGAGNPNAGDSVSCVQGNSTNVFFNNVIADNTFQSWAYTANSSSSATVYYNGILDNTFSGTTVFPLTNPQVIYNSATNNSQTFGNGINGFINYFAMGIGVLPQQLARLVHLDPWGVLIYPEDEMRSRLVGVGVAPQPSYGVLGMASSKW